MSKETPLLSSSLQRLEELQEGTRAAPKESELCLTLGEAFLRVNRVDEAVTSYQRAVELDPRSDLRALYWEWLGLVREMEGRLEEALEAYFQWVDADPVAMSPLDRLATLLVVLGRWTDLRLLRPQYTRRSEVAPTARTRESLALYTFVTEQLDEQNLERTRESTMAGLEADPDSPALRFLLGLLSYQEGQLELSRGEFERVLELDVEGLWQEQRFALDWNGAKARVMVAKLARLQGDQETALS
jgi:tetratricopeptide (TPR) repeat protein